MNDKTFTIPCTLGNLPDDETPIAFRPVKAGERVCNNDGSMPLVCDSDSNYTYIILAPKDQPAPEPAEQPAEENVLILRNPPKPPNN